METFSGYKLESLIDPIVDEGRGGNLIGGNFLWAIYGANFPVTVLKVS